MPRLIAPIEAFDRARINRTLHGRSVYRSTDVPGHNVFKGYTTWANNGQRGVGDALDIEGRGWRTPVVAAFDGVQTRFSNDTQKTEVIYLEGDGLVAVYAHINAAYEGTGKRWQQGETLGVLRGDLNWPHLHWELWMDGSAVSAANPATLRAKLLRLFGAPLVVVGPDGGAIDCHPTEQGGVTVARLRPVVEALGYEAHYRVRSQGPRIYLKPADKGAQE